MRRRSENRIEATLRLAPAERPPAIARSETYASSTPSAQGTTTAQRSKFDERADGPRRGHFWIRETVLRCAPCASPSVGSNASAVPTARTDVSLSKLGAFPAADPRGGEVWNVRCAPLRLARGSTPARELLSPGSPGPERVAQRPRSRLGVLLAGQRWRLPVLGRSHPVPAQRLDPRTPGNG